MTAPDHVLPMGAVAVAPSFPRSSEDTSPTYTWQYRADMKDAMREWVSHHLRHLDGDTPQVKARHIGEMRAVAEIRRPLFLAERLLLSSAVRDVLFNRRQLAARTVQRAWR